MCDSARQCVDVAPRVVTWYALSLIPISYVACPRKTAMRPRGCQTSKSALACSAIIAGLVDLSERFGGLANTVNDFVFIEITVSCINIYTVLLRCSSVFCCLWWRYHEAQCVLPGQDASCQRFFL